MEKKEREGERENPSYETSFNFLDHPNNIMWSNPFYLLLSFYTLVQSWEKLPSFLFQTNVQPLLSLISSLNMHWASNHVYASVIGFGSGDIKMIKTQLLLLRNSQPSRGHRHRNAQSKKKKKEMHNHYCVKWIDKDMHRALGEQRKHSLTKHAREEEEWGSLDVRVSRC